MERTLLYVAAVAGGLGVAAGAFGSHWLDLDPAAQNTYDIASRYHLIHAVALLICAAASDRVCRWSGWLFAFGIVLFCGSLYALAVGGPGWLGPVTPVGGLAFVAGWILLPFKRL